MSSFQFLSITLAYPVEIAAPGPTRGGRWRGTAAGAGPGI
jgi:hypothetical protein